MSEPQHMPGHDKNAQETQRFNLSTWALKNQALVLYFIILTLLAGVFAYTHLGQSEDPPFTFKVMIRTLSATPLIPFSLFLIAAIMPATWVP